MMKSPLLWSLLKCIFVDFSSAWELGLRNTTEGRIRSFAIMFLCLCRLALHQYVRCTPPVRESVSDIFEINDHTTRYLFSLLYCYSLIMLVETTDRNHHKHTQQNNPHLISFPTEVEQ